MSVALRGGRRSRSFNVIGNYNTHTHTVSREADWHRMRCNQGTGILEEIIKTYRKPSGDNKLALLISVYRRRMF